MVVAPSGVASQRGELETAVGLPPPDDCRDEHARGAAPGALIEALKDGVIGGAALDVTDPEPLPADHPLWDAPNLILTPHMSGAVPDSRRETVGMFAANLRHFVAAEPLENLVDPILGY